jgi:putative transposase
MQNYADKTIKELAKECVTVDDVHVMMKNLFKETLQEIFEAEMEMHLGYDKHEVKGNNSGNNRNGYSKKKIKTKFGETILDIPRDRNGEFEPTVVRKYESSVNGLEDQIIALYAKGVSTRDIEEHMSDIYGIHVSSTMVSKITDKILPAILEWQNRPLERLYPIVFLDAIHFKVRQDHRIVNKAAYSVLGINLDGEKDILGIWIGEHESASFWLTVCNDLKSRGIEDILIVCKDGLSGFSEAINAVFPQTNIQLCVIHELRNNIKHIPSKLRQNFLTEIRKVYTAFTLEQAEHEFQQVKEDWGEKYPKVIKSWEENWLELTAFFSYPTAIRKLIYTTNTIEGYHRQLRKVTKTKTAYPTDSALKKIIYLATQRAIEKWGRVPNWAECLSQFKIMFGSRLEMENNK